MAPDENDAPEEERWTEVGDAAPSPDATAQSSGEDVLTEQEAPHVYSGKQSTPPWRTSLYLGIVGLILMLVVFIFPELRRFNAPWDPSYPIAHFILLVPIFGLVFAAIGMLGQEYREDRSKAARGLVLAVVTIVLGVVVVTTDPALDIEETTVQDERLEMNEQELREWRIDKLNP